MYKLNIAGWSSLVARRAHNPKVVGSNPAPATNNPRSDPMVWPFSLVQPTHAQHFTNKNFGSLRKNLENTEVAHGIAWPEEKRPRHGVTYTHGIARPMQSLWRGLACPVAHGIAWPSCLWISIYLKNISRTRSKMDGFTRVIHNAKR